MALPHSSIAILLIIPTILGLLAAPSSQAESVLYPLKSLHADKALPCTTNNVLYSGERLYGCQSLTWESHHLIMQSDCNLVLHVSTGTIWTTRTNGRARRCYVELQTDGNLVLYSGAGQSVWASNTNGAQHNYVLVLQKDRNVILYGPSLWSTRTDRLSLINNSTTESGSGMVNEAKIAMATPANNVLYAGERLNGGQSLTWESYTFIMQTDCNLVLYEGNGIIWASRSNGRGSGCYVTMQRDGNLVIYSRTGNRIWASNTARVPGNYVLVLQKDRNVVIYGPSRWATNTHQFSLTSNSTTESGSGVANEGKITMVTK